MEQQVRLEIKRIRDKIECRKKFRCITADMSPLCEARDVGIESMLECLDENPDECQFSFAFYGYAYLCQCPIRIYLAKELHK